MPNVDVVQGDLLDQDIDVIVNAWNRNIIPWWLLLPQGVSGAIKGGGNIMSRVAAIGGASLGVTCSDRPPCFPPVRLELPPDPRHPSRCGRAPKQAHGQLPLVAIQ